jgi:hypothetical protein
MKRILVLSSLLIFYTTLYAQEDLLKELEQTEKNEIDYAFQTFKGTRLVNGHSVETKPKGNLEFIFAHRFGPVNGKLYELYGLDEAQVRLGLDYGVTDNLSLSIGRNSNDKTMDGYAKYKLIRQSKGAKIFPVSITALFGVGYKAFHRRKYDSLGFSDVDRLSYVSQLLIARKFNTKLSLQLMPTYVHTNAVYQDQRNNAQPALGIGGRLKLTKSVALTTEYYYRINPHPDDIYHNSLGFGIDIETGGHVFQLVMTNTRGLTERAFITETEGQFEDWGFQFGFNVTRTFQLKHKK